MSLKRLAILLACTGTMATLAGCGQSAMDALDRKTMELLVTANQGLGPETVVPEEWSGGQPPSEQPSGDMWARDLPTVNPAAADLVFEPAVESSRVIARLEGYAEDPEGHTSLDLTAALRYATRHGREYRFAEEEYLITALQLISERHLWGPRFFNDLEATAIGDSDDGLFDSSLSIINDLRVTQRLPYGGEVSARLLASATEDLHQRVAGENVQSAELILAADVPLLRGAGIVAQETLIQANRNIIYSARGFEQFRRDYLFSITTDYLDLVVRQLAIENAERQVATLEQFEKREVALVEAGRVEPFQAALAAQSTLFARDNLNSQRESYRLAIDRFKVRIGMPDEERLVIQADTPGFPTPDIADIDAAVQVALRYRLDLQNERDQVDDARRQVAIARNDLLADLNLAGVISIPTDDQISRSGLQFDIDDTLYRASITLGFPIDREIERANLRQAQIDLERAILEYDRFRDTVALDVRAAVRDIGRALFSRQLQEENVRVANLRLASIEAAPDRATARDRSEAADDLLRARDDLLAARRDLQVAILRYLLDSGQLRVEPDGTIRALRGMVSKPGVAAPAQGPGPAPDAAPVPAPDTPDAGPVPAPDPASELEAPEPAEPPPDDPPDPD